MILDQSPKYGFNIKYKIEEIPGKGKGIIADQFIPKGTVVWICDPHRCFKFKSRTIIEQFFIPLTPKEREYVLIHSYGYLNEMIMANDDSDYMNHSSDPTNIYADGYYNLNKIYPIGIDENTDQWIRTQSSVALRDIQVGEEITESYLEYNEPEWYIDLCKEYNLLWASKIAEIYG